MPPRKWLGWDEFVRVAEGPNEGKLACKHCGKIYSAKTNKRNAEVHIKNCSSCPSHVKALIQGTTENSEEGSESVPVIRRHPTASRRANKSSQNKQTKMRYGVLSPSEKEESQTLLARALIHCCIPPNVLRNPAFRDFVRFLCPNFIFPDPDRITNGDLLEKEYGRIKALVDENLKKAESITLSYDGGEDEARDPLSHVIAIADGKPFLDRAIRSATAKQSAAYITRQLRAVRDRIDNLETVHNHDENDDEKHDEERRQSKIIGFVSDSENKMREARAAFALEQDAFERAEAAGNLEAVVKQLQEQLQRNPEEDPAFPSYGCAFHQLSKTGEKIFDLVDQVVRDSTSIANSFRNHRPRQHLQEVLEKQGVLTNKQRIGIPMPGDTRSDSTLRMLKKIQSLREPMTLVSASADGSEYVPTEVKRLILNNDFWLRVQELIDRVDLLYIWNAKLQGNNSVGEAFYANSLIVEEATQRGDGELVEHLNRQWNRISHSCHAASFLVDPRFSSSTFLTQDDLADARRHLQKMCGSDFDEVWRHISDMRRRRGSFRRWAQIDFNYEKMSIEDVIAEYYSLDMLGENKLVDFAVRLLRLPATSAAVERSFSTVTRIHTKLRNRLSRESLDRMVFIVYNTQVIGYRETSEWKLANALI